MKKMIRIVIMLSLFSTLFMFNSCNLENGVNKNYIISQMKEKENPEVDSK